jgi:hypothetical protein
LIAKEAAEAAAREQAEAEEAEARARWDAGVPVATRQSEASDDEDAARRTSERAELARRGVHPTHQADDPPERPRRLSRRLSRSFGSKGSGVIAGKEAAAAAEAAARAAEEAEAEAAAKARWEAMGELGDASFEEKARLA